MVARDGNQGLAITEREEPDLVILDMMMPKRSGFLVLEKLRRTRENPPRIIMITANEGSRHKAYAEMNFTVNKSSSPFTIRMTPYLLLPYLRGRWLTGTSATLNPRAAANTGTNRCNSP